MNILQRLQDVLGFSEPYSEFDDDADYADEAIASEQDPGATQGSQRSNVIAMRGRSGPQSELIVMEPRSFEEVPEAIMSLRERKTVILNLGMMDPDQAQRSVDYVAGGVFAIDGHQERVGKNIFLFTPSSVYISNYPTVNPMGADPAASLHPPLGQPLSYGQSPSGRSLADHLNVKSAPAHPRYEVKPDVF
jgi:cell division inhibitor SepF